MLSFHLFGHLSGLQVIVPLSHPCNPTLLKTPLVGVMEVISVLVMHGASVVISRRFFGSFLEARLAEAYQ